jgi:hypothetical protein
MEAGNVRGRIEGLRLALKLRFQQAGLDLMPRIQAISDPVILERLFEVIQSVPNVETFAALLPSEDA